MFLAAIYAILSSKKGVAFLSTVVFVLGNEVVKQFGYSLDPLTVAEVVGSTAAYIVGQGIADHGKEKAKIEAQAAMMAAIATSTPASKPTPTVAGDAA